MVEELGNLPEGWIDTNLGSVTEYGKASKKTIADVDAATWILELEDIEKETTKLIARVNVKERPFKSTKNIFKKGDVLYGKLRPYLNKLMLADADGVCTTEIIPIDARPFCINKYIFYWLRNSIFLSYVNEVSYGVNMPRLGTSDGNNAPFRLAPYYEQKVIAEKLDLLLAQVDSIKTRLDQIPQILKRFRQAVLSAAVSGVLTGVQPKDSQLLSNIADVIGGLTKNAKRNELPLKKPYLRVANVYENELRLDDLSYIGVSEKELNRVSLEKGDIVIVEGNGSLEHIGRAAIWGEEIKGCIHQNHLIKVRCNLDCMNPYFLLYFFMSPQGKLQIINKATSGAGLYTLSISKISSIYIPSFSLEEQTEIVARVEKLFAWADNIEKQVAEAQKRVNNLTQSILAKAFRGELTEQWRKDNPDLISGENSAAALLERIKAERAAQTKKPKKKV